MDKYILVTWPDSQDYMELSWFRKEAFLANPTEDNIDIGSSAYFIPIIRYNQVMKSLGLKQK